MPNVDVLPGELFERLGRSYTEEELQELCFDFGIELDDVTSEYEKIKNEIDEQTAIERGASKDEIYTFDIPANRYDLLGLEGLAMGLNIFLGRKRLPEFKRTAPQYRMRVTNNTQSIRPYVVCAVLRDFNMDERVYERFIAIQEKLHFNICRERKYVAIGTHDLDKITPNFLYDARAPDSINFQALKEERSMTATELFGEYASRGKKLCSVLQYCKIIEDSPVYPIIYDKDGQVLSLPPIINSEYSKISKDTRNIFIECTATDLTKANIVLHTLIAGFSQYCGVPFEVEGVEVVYDNGMEYVTPTLEKSTFTTTQHYINRNLGTDFSCEKICELLGKMALDCAVQGNELVVTAPVIRSDILHAVDIVEDVAIAFGYNNLVRRFPEDMTIAGQQPLNKLSDQIRQNVAMAGFTEVLTWVLGPRKEAYDNMNLQDKGRHVGLSAPKTAMFEMCRINLLPGVLKVLQANQGKVRLPINLFELQDVVLLDQDAEVGARNERRLCACVCTNKPGGFELVHGLLDRVMTLNRVAFVHAENVDRLVEMGYKKYSLGKGECPTFLPGMQAEVLMENAGDWVSVGHFGIVHPTVVKKFGIAIPAMIYAMEINVECFA